MYSVVCILKDNRGNTVGAKITDGVSVKEVTTAQLRGSNLKFNNAILDRSGFLRAKRGNLKVELVKTEIILYHGSKDGIHGKISVSNGNNICDFGKGFYLGTSKLQAGNRICNDPSSVMYTFSLDISTAKVYTFTDNILWALYIGYNRGYFNLIGLGNDIRQSKLGKVLDMISRHDIIVGLIADDKISEIYSSFLGGVLNTDGLINGLKYCNYGVQYTIRNQMFCSSKYLKQLDKHILTKEERKQYLEWGKNIKSDFETNMQPMLLKYRRNGTFIDDILRDYGVNYENARHTIIQ